MKKTLMVLIIVAALAAGVGGAYATGRAITNYRVEALAAASAQGGGEGLPLEDEEGDEITEDLPYLKNIPPGLLKKERRWPDRKNWMGPGMMAPGGYNDNAERAGERISMDEAVTAAQDYAGRLGGKLRVAEVMEFSENFYAVVVEEDTGKGALELLIDAYTGRVQLEPGPTRMWNSKYGHMRLRVDESTANILSMEEAAAAAQAYLDEELTGAHVESDGVEFYGYYSFDYTVDGGVAGMLSVNATSGHVWPHTWHGSFIDEKEIDE